MLRLEGIEAGYGAVQVLRGLSFAVEPGEVLCLMGRNGVGKTTALRAIMGQVPVSAGAILLDGVAVQDLAAHDVPKEGIGYVPQGRRLFGDLTVAENIEIGLMTRGRDARVREKVLSIFPRLRERLGQISRTLSGGEQQMLAIGRGLMSEPKLLILDEPSLGLSPILVEEMFDLIGHINADGMSVLLVEQNVMQSLNVASRAYVLEQGHIVMQGDTAGMLKDPQLRQVYLGL